MKKLAFAAMLVGLVACSDGKKKVTIIDVDASTTSGVCNPIMQTGCDPGQKCNWIYDQVETPEMPDVMRVGHIGCEAIPASPIAEDQQCSDPDGSPPVGSEMCGLGHECVSGYCRKICDQQAVANAVGTCDGDHACVQYQSLFISGSATVAGVCNVLCDPWTQKAKIGAAQDACGSTSQTAPTKGCYGVEKFSCSRVAPFDAQNHRLPNAQALALTDRVAPAGAYSNACAPGYMSVLIAETGVTTGICDGLCAALESDTTQPAAARMKGDPAVLAKYPTAPAPAAGEATCNVGKRGAESTSMCRFLWPFRVTQAGELAITDTIDTMGICMGISHYKWDSNASGAIDAGDDYQTGIIAPATPCNALPKRTTTTTGAGDDAMDFQCQKVPPAFKQGRKDGTINVSSLMQGMVLPSVTLDDGGAVAMTRHQFN
jgi:hypothetical protein